MRSHSSKSLLAFMKNEFFVWLFSINHYCIHWLTQKKKKPLYIFDKFFKRFFTFPYIDRIFGKEKLPPSYPSEAIFFVIALLSYIKYNYLPIEAGISRPDLTNWLCMPETKFNKSFDKFWAWSFAYDMSVRWMSHAYVSDFSILVNLLSKIWYEKYDIHVT